MSYKRPLSNLSNNNYKAQSTNSLKRSIDSESENSNSTKKSKNHNNDIDQENEKSSVLKKILSVNNRIFENITNSNLKTSIYSSRKKDDKNSQIPTIREVNEPNNGEQFNVKDEDHELIEILNRNRKSKQIQDEPAFRIDFSDPINYYESPEGLPADVEDYDLKNIGDINAEAQFAYDIFEYYFMKEKQVQVQVQDYIDNQPEISRSMRAILGEFHFFFFAKIIFCKNSKKF